MNTQRDKPILYLVIPCYNEEAALVKSSRELGEKIHSLIGSGKISEKSRVMLVDDGSTDKTWEFIARLHKADLIFSGLRLSRNRGHQNALLAGLMTTRERADVTISIDADLQDDINAVDEMIEKYSEGCEIVYGVRTTRRSDTAFKRFTAESYYRLLRRLGGEIVFNHADYRLMSKTALNALSQYGEVNLFLRGIVPMLGFKTDIVKYSRSERVAGESKYTLRKMFNLAVEGITSLSLKPLRAIFWCGILSVLTVFFLLIAFLISCFVGENPFYAWKTLLLVTILMGGLILISIGIVGEYVGKIYMETKRRPTYHISEILE